MTPALPRILIYGDSLLLAGCEGTEVGIAGILVQLDPAITDLRVRESRTTRTVALSSLTRSQAATLWRSGGRPATGPLRPSRWTSLLSMQR
jgi:hypothetical protein